MRKNTYDKFYQFAAGPTRGQLILRDKTVKYHKPVPCVQPQAARDPRENVSVDTVSTPADDFPAETSGLCPTPAMQPQSNIFFCIVLAQLQDYMYCLSLKI